jgi:PST family polysaccharide transporter
MHASGEQPRPGDIASAPKPPHRFKALIWSTAEVAIRQLLTLFFSFGVLAFIKPDDLGLFTLAYALNQIPSVLLDDPIIEALIQKNDVTTRDWNTGFTANLVLTCASLLLSVAVSGWVADLMGQPGLRHALPIVTLCSVIGCLGYVQKGFLARELHFATMAKTMLRSQLIAGVIGLGLAIAGYGYWALIGNLVVFTVCNSIAFWRACPWKPRLQFDRDSGRAIFAYARHSTLVRLVLLLRDSAPSIIVGALYDAATLGLFALALRIARTLGLFFEDASRQPLMALMSREQGDRDGFAVLLLDIITVLGVLALPAFVGLALTGRYLPGLVFGAEWAGSGALLPWLCIVIAGWVVLHVISVSLRAVGQVKSAFRVLAPFVGLDLLCMVVLAPFGIGWALIGMSVRMVLSLPFLGTLMQSTLGVSVRALLGRWLLPIIGVLAMAAVVVLTIRLVGPDRVGVLAACLGGGAVYAAIVGIGAMTFDKRIIHAIKSIR